MMIMTKCPACDGTGFDDDACGCLKCDRTGKVPTQTQVTGPVDDADLKALIDAVDEFHTDVSANADMHLATISHYTAKINARLAPRADALIEREQVRKAVIAGAIEARGRSEDEQFSVITDAIMKISAITDSVMALLPRAPMPDVVTVRRDVIPLLVESLYDDTGRIKSFDDAWSKGEPDNPYTDLADELQAALEGK